MTPEGQRVQGLLDKIILITDTLLSEGVSFDTITEYLLDTTGEMDKETLRRVFIFLVLDYLRDNDGKA